MKVTVVSFFDTSEMRNSLKKHGFKIVEKNPDMVVTYGGDGTILYSERLYPSIPKLILKKSRICRKCDYSEDQLDVFLEKIKQKSYKIIDFMKVKAVFGNKELVGLNEIQVRSKLPTKAVRLSVSVGEREFKNVICDGVIIATPFGSTGYYKSAGGIPFEKGIGIVFNNPFSDVERSFVVSDDAKIKVRVERDEGLLIRDNDEDFVELKEGEEVLIEKEGEKGRFVEF